MTSSGSLMSEARRVNTPLRVLALELLRALTLRCYSNTHLKDSYQPPNTRVDSIYIAVRKALTHTRKRDVAHGYTARPRASHFETRVGTDRGNEKDHSKNGKRNR